MSKNRFLLKTIFCPNGTLVPKDVDIGLQLEGSISAAKILQFS